MFEVVCKNIGKSFASGKNIVAPLKNLTLTFPKDEITSVIGASGCGKTTLLRIIAGLEKPTQGEVSFNCERTSAPPKIGVAFQEPRLYPWLSVKENIRLAVRGCSREEQEEKIDRILQLVKLGNFRESYPSELSGGMAQRVGFARALVGEPDILLLDEAFSALDALMRRTLHRDFMEIFRARPVTAILVTHDVTEAVLLSKRIYRLEGGREAERFDVPFPYPRFPNTPGIADLSETIINKILRN